MNNHVLERPAIFSVDRISQILTAFDRGIGVTEISDVYNVDLRRVHSVIQAAQRIAKTYVTTKSCPRLYSSESRSLSVPMGFYPDFTDTSIKRHNVPIRSVHDQTKKIQY